MSYCAALLLVLSLLLPVQTPRDSFKLHYEKAEALRRKGDLSAAEAEYTAILSETYYTLGKILLAQPNYPESVAALEAAANYHSDSDEENDRPHWVRILLGWLELIALDPAFSKPPLLTS